MRGRTHEMWNGRRGRKEGEVRQRGGRERGEKREGRREKKKVERKEKGNP